ncbi:hypothetical protein PR048_008584 [Dryococelus australis]|uniref:Uncharacterized protein n=1 Tax=Dryococelus australis TaxID=614101 RepID=A0ABQ9HYG9_9NEOP|nr:hypothetical protein PR048_008584 [Dryococelus australis]
MNGTFKGAQAYVATVQPLAFYSHHTTCTVASIRNAVGVTSSVANFFRKLAGRIHKLEEEMQDRLPQYKKGKHTLKKMCETRWIKKEDAVLTFLDTLPWLSSILDNIS